jgi:hypothetical protein
MLKTQKYCMRKIKIHINIQPRKEGKRRIVSKKTRKNTNNKNRTTLLTSHVTTNR